MYAWIVNIYDNKVMDSISWLKKNLNGLKEWKTRDESCNEILMRPHLSWHRMHVLTIQIIRPNTSYWRITLKSIQWPNEMVNL